MLMNDAFKYLESYYDASNEVKIQKSAAKPISKKKKKNF